MRTEPLKPVHRIKKLILSGEGQQLDFKFEINDAKKIARTFSAFSNTLGGKLLIGVKDNGKISGIQSDEETYMVESAAHLYCKPRVEYHIEKWKVEGKWVLEVEIPPSKSKPHYAPDEKGKWIAYVRVGDENLQAGRVLIALWKNQRKRKGAYLPYKSEAKALMEYLDDHHEISFSKFTRIARIGPKQAEEILVNLALMDAIEIVVNEHHTTFKRKET